MSHSPQEAEENITQDALHRSCHYEAKEYVATGNSPFDEIPYDDIMRIDLTFKLIIKKSAISAIQSGTKCEDYSRCVFLC